MYGMDNCQHSDRSSDFNHLGAVMCRDLGYNFKTIIEYLVR